MADQGDLDYAGVVQVFDNFLTGNYLSAAAMAFLAFDWIIGLPREIQLFWGNASVGATSLYAGARYLTLFCNLIYTLEVFEMSTERSVWGEPYPVYSLIADRIFRCTRLVWTSFVVGFLAIIPLLALAVLRVYALTQRRLLAAFIFWLLFIPLGASIVPYTYNAQGVVDSIFGCFEADFTPVALFQKWMWVPRMTLFVILTSMPLTYSSAPRRRKLIETLKDNGRTMASIILYNGLIYFVALVVVDTLHLVLSVLSVEDLGGASVIIELRNPIASVLVSHFLLDLQEAHKRSVLLDSHQLVSSGSSAADSGTISFARTTSLFSATIDHNLPGIYDSQGILGPEDEAILVIGGPEADDVYWHSDKV
ncbi:hypothetical protein DICSQDRAFT_168230 [Dichomitus squalens LYAD-421 SS1]|uniref:uncharacterized protein n=1 Tax=Dichomitus squalens (strain LYAD-421) TaxID=732165 RepID=UPI0004412331|nr:uncharacterized protein DICSQDRAFT_168230 [Dichomitus squalens LYAD-421 SS1]EJF63349.1 hypothetical protein DICSQDRAFT_168230 [Dichomitus squalens LYAD-421 SS1]